MIINRLILKYLLILQIFSVPCFLKSQTIGKVKISPGPGLKTDSIVLSDGTNLLFKRKKPILSFLIDEKNFNTGSYSYSKDDSSYYLTIENRVRLILNQNTSSSAIWNCTFENVSDDTIFISNVIPFEQDNETVIITGYGPPDLARACLFRPGYRPLRIILPDNAWEMGYASFNINRDTSICAVSRRIQVVEGERMRYKTRLPPRAKVIYRIYFEVFTGEWQNGLKKIFRDKYLFDLEKFNNNLYERQDLAWIKESYLIVLQMAWDREFYNRLTGKYTFPDILRNSKTQFGYIDVYGIWPTWPRLGLDQRNQWDLYRDLPGGTAQLKNFSRLSHQNGTRFFISYNPWDKSTRKENHMKGLARLISETEADGVVLDTQGNSSIELQNTADSVRKGVIMYSEGMAVAKDMPGIISGRVHNAIYFSPELNLNKLIKPDFSIFRVCDVGEDELHREIAIAFFNGYGTELNLFRPGGRNENYKADLDFLAETTFILRQNNDAFLDPNWTPLIETSSDNIFVNRWKSADKEIFTVLNMKHEGFSGELFKTKAESEKHYVSLWRHEDLVTEINNEKLKISVVTSGWPQNQSGTRKEGSVDCIAALPVLLKSSVKGDSIAISSLEQGEILIWKGNPAYSSESKEINIKSDTVVSVMDLFGFYEGKIVIQLLENKHLRDENILRIKGGKPWLISKLVRTERAVKTENNMVLIPGAEFRFSVNSREEFIPYPDISNMVHKIDSFLIDKYPVTNAQYYEFISNSGYKPVDTTRYLRHWEYGIYKPGTENYPVVYVSYDDMNAYAKWAGKRLPTEPEWQLAAQGLDNRQWPWGNDFHATLCNNAFGKSTPVDAFSKGASPYGVMDLVGNIWQVTNDMYFNGSYYFLIIRGGSFYKPDSSWWYIEGGPQPLNKTQIMLLVSPGFDRNATVGFRCVKDIDKNQFRSRR